MTNSGQIDEKTVKQFNDTWGTDVPAPGSDLKFGDRWTCPSCGESNTRTNDKCYVCKMPRPATKQGGPAQPASVALDAAGARAVKIVDINIPIGSLATLMLKALVASIPVMIIVGIAIVALNALFFAALTNLR